MYILSTEYGFLEGYNLF